MLTNGQKKALHAAAREIGLDDEQRRLVQRNVGGFDSAAARQANRYGFIAVMACFEAHAPGRKLQGFSPGYWAEQDRMNNPTDGLAHRACMLANAIGWTAEQLDRFIQGPHMSNGMCDGLTGASAYWLTRVINALQAMASRRLAAVPAPRFPATT